MTFKRILCPVDFSPHSEHALGHAAMVARWYGSEVTILHARSEFEDPEQAIAELTRMTDSIGRTDVPIRTRVQSGSAVEAVLGAARSLPADLIVLGTHGRGGWDHLVLGSVMEKVLRKASCPVLTVPPPVSGPTHAAPLGFERIVAALDFSDWSMSALRFAASLAQESGARLIAVHVLDGLHTENLTAYPDFDLARFRRHLEDDARSRVREAIPSEVRPGAEEVVAIGRPHEEIVRLARERDAHLIVIGVHGRTALDLMMVGSTTHQVIRTASCPVLTLRG